jgi:glycosyltransferase involved in cell wall biosynthesis
VRESGAESKGAFEAMRICYIVSEYFEWGQYGGYGAIARSVAEGLARRGHEVFALVNKKTEEARREQRDVEVVEGVTVVGLPQSYVQRLRRRELYRRPGADLYVSVDARFDSWMAMRMNPQARHAIWFVDPMSFETFWELHNEDPRGASFFEKLRTRLIFQGLQVFSRRAVQRADCLLSQPQCMSDAALAVYPTSREIRFAPNPVELPTGPTEKAQRPLVLFLGRFDWQKQPELFLALAREMPEVDFVAAGAASDPSSDAALRARYAGFPNLELPGVVTGAEKDALLRRTWILCNTSLREGLPRSFQEALSYRCAIVAAVDPDRIVSRFGAVVSDGDFAGALRRMLANDAWRALGEAGRAHIAATHGSGHALDIHESLYNELAS